MTNDRPSVLLYDWDNTLVDGWAGITAALNAAFTAFDKPLWTVEDTRHRVRVSLRESFPVMFGDAWERARDVFYQTLADQHLDHVRPMPHAEEALAAGAPWPQGVVSNKAGAFLRREVVHLGWSDHFGAVVGAGDAAIDKPDPAPIHLALARLGRTADPSVWYLGDTALDMQAARAAGVTAVLIGTRPMTGELHEPRRIAISPPRMTLRFGFDSWPGAHAPIETSHRRRACHDPSDQPTTRTA